ncbi:MAG: type II toxin-antitoxin system RelE/ParE family toxin [Leptolyngbyaceae cyanobacterium bins.302]|nr:type II toxin-antitoxin system RelE/ParE family toxin [Leptolyngbyaceae cyanobacterium bins.302]
MQEAVDYYDAINPELGDAFLDEVERALERIVNFPNAWAQLSPNTRRCRLLGFPYGIIYQSRGDRILVVAVMHFQRKPNYWSDRT